MNKYDIYWAEVKFQENNETKTRPALIIGGNKDTVSVLKITTKGTSCEYQYEIIEWEAAGLSKPSYISYEPKIILPRKLLGNKMGKLQLADQLRFEMKLLERL